MAIYTPYFYIIQDVRNYKYYAGVRYAKRSRPSELLTKDGYQTSSKTVQEIIKTFGLEVFTIRKIKTFYSKNEALRYETRFLEKVNARGNPMFYNKSNNEGHLEREKALFLKYGVDSYSKTDEYLNKMRKFSTENFGVEHHLMSPEIIEKREKTMV